MPVRSFEKGTRSENIPDTIVFHSTGAGGDDLLSIPIETVFRERGVNVVNANPSFAFPLRSAEQRGDERAIDGAVHVTVADYQKGLPHFEPMPETPPQEHLSRWIAYTALSDLERQGYYIDVSYMDVGSDDVKVELSEDELAWGQNEIKTISEDNEGKPVVIVAPNAATMNRNLDPERLQATIDYLQDEAVVLLLEPLDEIYDGIAAGRVNNEDIRKTAALLRSAYVVSVDSFPLHAAAAVRQGTPPELADKLGLRKDNSDILMVAGSSSNATIGYNRIRVVHGTECPLSWRNRGCGMHGYLPLDKYEAYYDLPVYPSSRQGDNSGCIYPEYADGELPPCMRHASTKLLSGIRAMLAANAQDKP